MKGFYFPYTISNSSVDSEASVIARKEMLMHETGRDRSTLMLCRGGFFFLSSLSSLGLASLNA